MWILANGYFIFAKYRDQMKYQIGIEISKDPF